MSNNSNLHDAKTAKNDEFYTNISDIEKELKHYKEHFKDKIVLCNCDDPFESAFFKYFVLNFNELGLKKLICTCYAGSPVAGQQLSLFDFVEPHNSDRKNRPYKAVVTTVHDTTGDGGFDLDDVINLFKNGENTLEELNGDGDFRSEECLALLDECDICCTNEPFSLFREFIATMVAHEKKFLIIGNLNAITYKETFPLLKDNKMWLGYTHPKEFIRPDGSVKSFGNVCWFTNLDIKKRHEKLVLWQRYYDDNGNPLPDAGERYPQYDNYDAINVDKVSNIPVDYVPCWFNCPTAERCAWAQKEGMNAAVEALCELSENAEETLTTSESDRTILSGQVRSGQVRSGQVRSGQVRSGQVRSGQVRSGQVRRLLRQMQWRHRRSNHISRQTQSRTIQTHWRVQPWKRRRMGLREMHCRWKREIQTACNSSQSVMESWECLLPSSTSSAQNSLTLSEQQKAKERDYLVDCGMLRAKSHNPLYSVKENTSAYLYVGKCNGIMGVPLTYIDNHNPDQFDIIGASGYDDTPCRIARNYRSLGFKFFKKDGITESGSGALKDRTSAKIKSKGNSDYSVSPEGEFLSAVYYRIFIRRKKQQ